MSIIYGIVNTDYHQIERRFFYNLKNNLSQFQLDNDQVLIKDNLAFGNKLLYSDYESLHENLPFEDKKSGLIINADAVLDNRDELISSLGGKQYILDYFNSNSSGVITDSHLILLSFIKFQEKCLNYLLGDFVFTIWDEKERTLFCARDFIGARPLRYYYDNKIFVFSSDLSALLSLEFIPNDLDEICVYDFLFKITPPVISGTESTFFKYIKNLSPGHYLKVKEGKIEITKYWSPENVPKINLRDENEYHEMFSDLLYKSVNSRLRSNFQVGSHISSGLDSTSITVLAARELKKVNKNLKAFSWAPSYNNLDKFDKDERKVIEQISNRESFEVRFTEFNKADYIDFFGSNINIFNASLSESQVLSTVSKCGIRTILSGWGGDDFASYNGIGFLADLFLKFRWLKLTSEIFQTSNLTVKKLKVPYEMLRLFYGRCFVPILPDKLFKLFFYTLTKEDENLLNIFNRDFAKLMKGKSNWKIFRERPGVRKEQIKLYYKGHITRRIDEWFITGALNKLIYRYPLLDKRIVEFSLGIPEELYHKNGTRRYLLTRFIEKHITAGSKLSLTKFDNTFHYIQKLHYESFKEWLKVVRNKEFMKRDNYYVNIKKLENLIGVSLNNQFDNGDMSLNALNQIIKAINILLISQK